MIALIVVVAAAIVIYAAIRVRASLRNASDTVDRILREEVTERRGSRTGGDTHV